MNMEETFRSRISLTITPSVIAIRLGVLAITLSTLVTTAQAQNPPGNVIFDLVPIGSTGAVTSLVGSSIEIPAGGVVVELELRVSNWATTGDGLLHSVQATIDGTSYCSGIGDPLNPLGYPGAPVLACPQGQGCPVDGDTCDQGAFVTTGRCTVGFSQPPTGAPCVNAADCPGEFCLQDPEFLFFGYSPLLPIGYPGLNYEIATFSQGPSKPDITCVGGNLDGFGCQPGSFCPGGGTCTGPPRSWYFGTLLVEIPTGAAGTYNIDFSLDSERTLSGDGTAASFAVVNLNGATITVTSGACCFNIGPGSTQCMHNITKLTCDSLPQPAFFRPGEECPPISGTNHGPDFGNGPCCGSGCQFDLDCNDGNACTDDICSAEFCGCININNFNDTTDCCNPFSGSLTSLDDFDPCTNDICDIQTGQVSHDPIVDCTACLSNIDCDDSDACTDDVCDLITGECSNPLSYDVVTQCCDSTTGAIVTFGDGDPCTDDFCDPQTLQVTNTRIAGCISASNRYITFYPDRGIEEVNYNVTETLSGRQQWLLPPTSDDEIITNIARLTNTMPAPRVWNSAAMHVGDCLISPGHTYSIRSTTDGINFSTPVFVDTVDIPTDARHWADCASSFDGATGNWGAPDGLVSTADILAVIRAFELVATSVPLPWADISPARPNGIVNTSDILDVVRAFGLEPYPHPDPVDCP